MEQLGLLGQGMCTKFNARRCIVRYAHSMLVLVLLLLVSPSSEKVDITALLLHYYLLGTAALVAF